MRKNEFVPKIPYGMRDFLPGEVGQKRQVEESLIRLFARWGYEEIITPTMEYMETLQAGSEGIEAHLYKFFDRHNRLLALRPDMTTPIARVAATRLKDQEAPLRLCYLANVFRYEEAQAGRQCEFYQAGVELLGEGGATADAEVVALAVESLLDAGLVSFQISLGQVDFINGLLAEAGLQGERSREIRQALTSRDLVGLEKLLADSGISAGVQQLLRRIPLLHGKRELLEEARSLVNNDVSRRALDNLAQIYALLEHYGVAEHVVFDLGVFRNFSYYTGMVFEAYTPGLGFPVLGGGRYDQLAGAYGQDCPATGFALGIERVLLARQRQKLEVCAAKSDVYISWAKNGLGQAIQRASSLRQEGLRVELAAQEESRNEAQQRCEGRCCGRLEYYTGD